MFITLKITTLRKRLEELGVQWDFECNMFSLL